MKSAQSAVDQIENSAGKIVQLENESVVRSNELLQQLSEIVDGFVNLSAPFKYSSAGRSENDSWVPPDYGNKLLAVTEASESQQRTSVSR